MNPNNSQPTPPSQPAVPPLPDSTITEPVTTGTEAEVYAAPTQTQASSPAVQEPAPVPSSSDGSNTPRLPWLAIAALAIGVLSLPAAFFVLGGISALVGLVLGVVSLSKKEGNKYFAIAGIVLNALAAIIAGIMFLLSFAIFKSVF